MDFQQIVYCNDASCIDVILGPAVKEFDCGLRMNELLYADGQVILASSETDLQEIVTVMHEALTEKGMKVNMSTNKKEIYERLLQTEMEIEKLLEDSNRCIKVLLIHKYNDIKDATQVVINHIANIEETTVSEIHKRLGLD